MPDADAQDWVDTEVEVDEAVDTDGGLLNGKSSRADLEGVTLLG